MNFIRIGNLAFLVEDIKRVEVKGTGLVIVTTNGEGFTIQFSSDAEALHRFDSVLDELQKWNRPTTSQSRG